LDRSATMVNVHARTPQIPTITITVMEFFARWSASLAKGMRGIMRVYGYSYTLLGGLGGHLSPLRASTSASSSRSQNWPCGCRILGHCADLV
jgi:hypothetical protein